MSVSIKIKDREFTVDEAKEIFVELKKVFGEDKNPGMKTPYVDTASPRHPFDMTYIGTPFWCDAKSQSVKAGFTATDIGGGSSN